LVLPDARTAGAGNWIWVFEQVIRVAAERAAAHTQDVDNRVDADHAVAHWNQGGVTR
jgi:hypothetical protein